MREELSQLKEKVSKSSDGKVDSNTVIEALNKAEESLMVLFDAFFTPRIQHNTYILEQYFTLYS